MPVIETAVNSDVPEFKAHYQQNEALITAFRSIENKVRQNSQKREATFRRRNQLLPRERLDYLLDPASPFIELSSLAGYQMHDDDGDENAAGGGVITGIGWVSGVRCVVFVHDSAIKGGAVAPMGLQKSLRAQEIALQHKLPMVILAESAGANLLYQAEIFVDGGRLFANMARLSAAGIPQITVVHGSSTAGGAYLPGMSDYVVMIRDKSKVFLAGPPLVKAALGEEATDEELGGAIMHATCAGTAEYLAEDDQHGIQIARDLLAKLPWQQSEYYQAANVLEPRYPIGDVLGIVPPDYKTPYDVREVISRLVDDSDFLEFKPLFCKELICGHAKISGFSCGIIGNNGPIYPEGSMKAAQFIQLCCQSAVPLIFLHNTTGYMVGKQAEAMGAIKHGSKMIQAVTNATVPKISLVIGGSFGAGNYGMCGRAFDPNFCFSWPNSQISVMGGAQAAKVMELVTIEKYKKQGKPISAEVLSGMTDKIKQQFKEQSTALYATARLWDDGIIDPRDSRRVLSECLAICAEAETRQLKANSFGVARM
ncbi:acyl-CoA carboxylase subunit beta [Endozoicomonas sp. SM1973]|uniref:Acyl-CoA carboxylase subunit beta n=1 Tax=Spartinivicinus marinus TaxID=2994442 RepID=A0A853IB85_9GAMM|nr:carboxyl transferase domain-containing protein [Spartinivicinus marinus]MCX4028679.1 acyl-CoA carboxylase subunit beta [Spartinivicinus marinus]NYZ69092.1 acyl-CoA carboxylase subunit beta [Spartinivicinus marinus]